MRFCALGKYLTVRGDLVFVVRPEGEVEIELLLLVVLVAVEVPNDRLVHSHLDAALVVRERPLALVETSDPHCDLHRNILSLVLTHRDDRPPLRLLQILRISIDCSRGILLQ